MTQFPERLQWLREGKKLKRIALSELCGLHRDAIRRYERSEQRPDVDALIAIADYFDVSIDFLLGRTDNKRGPLG